MSNFYLDHLRGCFSIDESINPRKPCTFRDMGETLHDVNPWSYLKHEQLHDILKYLPIKPLEDELRVFINFEDLNSRGYYFVHIPYPEEFHSEEDYLYVMFTAAAIACMDNPRFLELLPDGMDIGHVKSKRYAKSMCYIAAVATFQIFNDFDIDIPEHLDETLGLLFEDLDSNTAFDAMCARNLRGLMYSIYREKLEEEKEYEQLRQLQSTQSLFDSKSPARKNRYHQESKNSQPE